MLRRLAPSVALVAALAAQQPARILQPDDLAARAAAAATLADALEQGDGPLSDARLRGALIGAAVRLPAGSAARVRADALRARTSAADALRLAVAELVADLTFRPVAEADLPDGVPGYRALDELEIRSYPAYRMVRASMRHGGTVAFAPLFRHIQERDIAMTTPVQVDYGPDGERPATMAFLYGSPELGPPGEFGRAEVVDVPPLVVLSIGSRGYERRDRTAELRARLDVWLAASTTWRASGPMRVMTYNSPSVGADRRYFEVQVPIVRRATTASVRESI